MRSTREECGLVLSVSDESGQILQRLYLQTSFQTVYAPPASTVQRQRRHPRTGNYCEMRLLLRLFEAATFILAPSWDHVCQQ